MREPPHSHILGPGIKPALTTLLRRQCIISCLSSGYGIAALHAYRSLHISVRTRKRIFWTRKEKTTRSLREYQCCWNMFNTAPSESLGSHSLFSLTRSFKGEIRVSFDRFDRWYATESTVTGAIHVLPRSGNWNEVLYTMTPPRPSCKVQVKLQTSRELDRWPVIYCKVTVEVT